MRIKNWSNFQVNESFVFLNRYDMKFIKTYESFSDDTIQTIKDICLDLEQFGLPSLQHMQLLNRLHLDTPQ